MEYCQELEDCYEFKVSVDSNSKHLFQNHSKNSFLCFPRNDKVFLTCMYRHTCYIHRGKEFQKLASMPKDKETSASTLFLLLLLLLFWSGVGFNTVFLCVP